MFENLITVIYDNFIIMIKYNLDFDEEVNNKLYIFYGVYLS